MSDLYQYGETVDITLRGAQVFSCSVNGLFITLPGSECSVALPVTSDGTPIDSIRVDRVSPAGGPVEPGDVWRDAEGGVWLAYTKNLRHGGSEVWLTRGGSEDDAGNVRAVSGDFGPLTLLFRESLVSQPANEVLTGEVTSPFGPCSGLAADRRDNTCTNFAAEYVEYQCTVTGLVDEHGTFSPASATARLCTSCADAAPGRISRRPLTTKPGGYPIEIATPATAEVAA